MNALLRKSAFALTAALLATEAFALVTFYDSEDFGGRAFTTSGPVENFQRSGFNDRASSVVVERDRWEVCENPGFGGRCVVLRPGRYPSLAAMGLSNRVSSVRDIDRDARIDDYRYAPLPSVAQITFYEQEGFGGRSFSTEQPVANFQRSGFNNLASSVVVAGERWEVCEDARYGGRCVVLRPGRYPSLASMGLNNRISSVRDVNSTARIDDYRFAPLPAPVADQHYHRRADERLYEANVTSVRAVVGPPEQRCWVERSEVAPERSKASIPGAVVGAILGGILGHQVGSGRGQDIATAGGAVAGGVLGAKVGGRVGGAPAAQDVQRCENVTDQAPSYYDVTYSFRGVEHRVQMAAPPGPTISVNESGEPRA